MRTAGSLLKEARIKKKKTLLGVAQQTKVKEKFLRAIEAEDWGELPNLPVAQGFVRSYAGAVGVDITLATALLRRDFPEAQKTRRSPEISLARRTLWTPKTTIFAATAFAILVLGIYLIRQYLLYVSSPSLSVAKIQKEGNIVVVLGKTNPSATVEVNGKAVVVEGDGSFKAQLSSEDAGDVVKVKATSRTGKETVMEKPVD
ncbi:MAG: helix-turn-helix transcriptional regulator [bacterium]|nr:helix-turn-helix transcriptional regulator [bacterium]